MADRSFTFNAVLQDEEVQEKVVRTVSPVASFWLSMNILQRSAGALGYYSGRRGSIVLGTAVVSLGSIVGHYISTQINNHYLTYCNRSKTISWWGLFDFSGDRKRKSVRDIHNANEHQTGLTACRTVLTVVMYSMFSLNWCQTAFPSSIITIGSYAKGCS